MSLKMPTVCLNASLETLQPLCSCCTLHVQGDLCHFLCKDLLRLSRPLWCFWHAMFSKTARGFEVCTPWKPILSADEGCSRCSHSWVVLAFWAGTESYWKRHSFSLKKVMLRCFTTPCSTSSWYTQTPVSPLSCKNEDVWPPDGTPPTRPWHRKGDGLPAPPECTSKNIWA